VWVLLGLLSVVAISYGSVTLLIQPLRQAKVTALGVLATYQEQNDKAELDLRGLDDTRAEVERLRGVLAGTTNQYVLRPLPGGNLLDPLKDMVEPMAKEYGLVIDSWSERGRMEMPVNKKDAIMTIDRYQTEMAMTGPYAAVCAFVSALERTNSYVCVTELEILGQASDVQQHKIRLGMEWPVFGVQPTAVAPARTRRP
jgi:hypothetical protein